VLMQRLMTGLTLTLVFACGDTTPAEQLMSLASPQQLAQIRNGSNDMVDRGVVGLAIMTAGGSGACSGSLIARNVVLTARHCIASLGNADRGVQCNRTTAEQTYSARQVYVTLEAALRQSPSDYVAVAEIVTPDDRLLCNTDIALLKLKEPVRLTDMPLIVPRIDSRVNDGEVYTIVGYGGTDDAGNGAGQRRIGNNHNVTCVDGRCPRWAARDREWGGNGGVCKGDSGGPAIDLQGRVIGVASRGGESCSSSIYSSVAGWGDWITDHVIQFTREENVEVPLWADGWPTDPAYNAELGDLCVEDSECGYGRCIDGYCTRKCDTDDHCPPSHDCHNSWCLQIPQPIGAECDIDVQCESDACADGVCVQYCEAHSECPEGFGCDDSGRCAEGVSRDSGLDGATDGSDVSVPSILGCSSLVLDPSALFLLLGLRRRRRRIL
jgi:hypothetical protein